MIFTYEAVWMNCSLAMNVCFMATCLVFGVVTSCGPVCSHSVTTQYHNLTIFTAVRTSNLTNFKRSQTAKRNINVSFQTEKKNVPRAALCGMHINVYQN
jgi:hypothetical protein